MTRLSQALTAKACWAQRWVPVALVFVILLLLSACAEQTWANDEAVQAARYHHGGAPELTLVTIMNYTTGRGDHTALFINATERVLFDPAGSWALANIPERNDVHFGMTPAIGASFYASHVRPSHFAVVQRLAVAPDVAEMAQALALQTGPVPPARCASATSRLLQQLPGLESIRSSYFPHVVMQGFATLPGVVTYELHHDSTEFQAEILAVQRPI